MRTICLLIIPHIQLDVQKKYGTDIIQAVVDDDNVQIVMDALEFENKKFIDESVKKNECMSLLKTRHSAGLYDDWRKLRSTVSSQTEFLKNLTQFTHAIMKEIRKFEKNVLPKLLETNNKQLLSQSTQYLNDIETDIMKKLQMLNNASTLFEN